MEDRQLLLDNINNGTVLDYDWNALSSRAERDSTLFKATAIDGISRDEIPYNNTTPPVFESKDYAKYAVVKHQGSEKESEGDNDIPPIFDAEENNKTGLPIFYMSYRNPDTGFNHGMNICFTGDDTSNSNNKTIGIDDIIDLYDYTGIEPQNNPPNVLLKFNQNYNPPENVEFTIKTIKKWLDYNSRNYGFIGQEALKFKINSEGKPELMYKNPNVIETREQAMDANYPLLTITTPQQDSTYKTSRTPLNFSISDDHFDRIGYSLNNADTTWLTIAENSFDIESIEGENIILFIAEDKAGNQTLEEIRYYGDENYVGIEDASSIPLNFKLYQNYPNPFNPSTTIQFDIPQVETGHALSLQLIIYNINGEEIATLIDNINTSGTYSIEWNASGYPSGIYLYQLVANSQIIATKKMLLLR